MVRSGGTRDASDRAWHGGGFSDLRPAVRCALSPQQAQSDRPLVGAPCPGPRSRQASALRCRAKARRGLSSMPRWARPGLGAEVLSRLILLLSPRSSSCSLFKTGPVVRPAPPFVAAGGCAWVFSTPRSRRPGSARARENKPGTQPGHARATSAARSRTGRASQPHASKSPTATTTTPACLWSAIPGTSVARRWCCLAATLEWGRRFLLRLLLLLLAVVVRRRCSLLPL